MKACSCEACTRSQQNGRVEMATAEMSNPGTVGLDTGYEFKSPRTGGTVRVIARVGEDRSSAIRRVRAHHGV
jgi:hypothetical protein